MTCFLPSSLPLSFSFFGMFFAINPFEFRKIFFISLLFLFFFSSDPRPLIFCHRKAVSHVTSEIRRFFVNGTLFIFFFLYCVLFLMCVFVCVWLWHWMCVIYHQMNWRSADKFINDFINSKSILINRFVCNIQTKETHVLHSCFEMLYSINNLCQLGFILKCGRNTNEWISFIWDKMIQFTEKC